MKAVVMENVSWTYQGKLAPALKNINLEVEEGEFIGIVGPNEAGKSTFCYLLNGLIPHMLLGRLEGHVRIFGQDTRHTSPAQLARRVGLVFQDPETQLTLGNPYYECAFGPENLGVPPEEIKRRVENQLKFVGLWERRSDFLPNLSGGMKQRLAIAATLAMHPDLLVMDEPTSNLDPLGSMSIFQVAAKLKKERKLTVFITEHKIEDLVPLIDRILFIHNGEIICNDEPKRAFQSIELSLRIGVEPPQVTLLSHALREKLESFPIFFSIDEAYEGICKLLDSKSKKGDN